MFIHTLPMLWASLQLFAVNLNLQTTEASDLSDEMKTYYDMTLIDEAGPMLVHAQFGQERNIPKGGGKTIEFRKFDNLPKALTPLTEGVTPTGGALKVTKIEATVRQYGAFVALSDMLELTAIDPVITEATKLNGRQMGRTEDTVIREVLQAGTNVSYCPKIGAEGAETPVTMRSGLDATAQLTVKEVRKAITKLKAANAPKINGNYVCIIHPYVAFDLMSDKQWREPHTYVDTDGIYEGEIGKIEDCRFVETTEARIYSGGDCPEGLAVFGTLFLGADAYGVTKIDGGASQVIVKPKGSGGTEDPLNQRSTIGWKSLLTAEILMQPYMVRVESCSKEYSATAKENLNN